MFALMLFIVSVLTNNRVHNDQGRRFNFRRFAFT